ncbi:MAG: hypothetical protein EON90_09145 [Brevundimonas sp.]|nr:MAG: hypothetical protein EON90_09145 [Brevundimonas sp.]
MSMSPWLLAAAALAMQDEPQAPRFSLRSDPQYAQTLSRVLGDIAAPVTVRLPEGQDAAQYFSITCDGPPPGGHSQAFVDGAVELTFVPCVRVRRNARATVLRNGRLEAMAVRFGLAPSAVTDLTVIPRPGSGRTGDIAAAALQVGDIVIAPQAADWTDFSAADSQTDRTLLVERLAGALSCGDRPAEACLIQHRIFLQEGAPPTPTSPSVLDDEEPADEPHGAEARVSSGPLDFLVGRLFAGPRTPDPRSQVRLPTGSGQATTARSTETDELLAALFGAARADALDEDEGRYAAARVDIGADEAAAAAPASGRAFLPADAQSLARASVAPEQWPYDAVQVAKVLAASRDRFGPRRDVLIGVADGGLADRAGAPLPQTMFAQWERDDPEAGSNAEPDNIDDDENYVVDDLIGSGVRRGGVLPDGDVGFCPRTPLDVSDWSAQAKGDASHGVLVAGLAGAYPLVRRFPDIGDQLPRLQFYRLAREACSEESAGTAVADVAQGYTFLAERVEIIVLSMLSDSRTADAVTNLVESSGAYETKLLFLPAGNEPVDLDQPGQLLCPACLVKAPYKSGARVLLVGAAGRDLQPTATTARGAETVRLYAPGETGGLVNIAGETLGGDEIEPAYLSSTSYAAPHAALAAGLLASTETDVRFDNARAIRERLMLSTWSARGAGPRGRVVDLLKVAAARFESIEVVEDDAGQPVLKTYIGTIQGGGLSGLCGRRLARRAFQGVRLGSPDANGERRVSYFGEATGAREPEVPREVRSCSPEGSVTLVDLDGASHEIPWSSVTQVLFPW